MANQSATNGVSQAAGAQFVKFTRTAAQRIAKAVRIVEAGNRGQSAVVFDHPVQNPNQLIRTASFTGSWPVGSVKNVAFVYRSGTANAYNDLMNLPSNGTRKCIIGREGTAWRLINWQWDVAYAATAATLTTSVLRFDAAPVGAVATSSSVTFSVSVATCATA